MNIKKFGFQFGCGAIGPRHDREAILQICPTHYLLYNQPMSQRSNKCDSYERPSRYIPYLISTYGFDNFQIFHTTLMDEIV